MLGKKLAVKISMVFLMLGMLALPQLSYADWGYGWHGHPDWGYRVRALPPHYVRVGVGLRRYYYYDGLYYANAGRYYTLVAPPVGAYVSAIPADFRVVVIRGKKYYADHGVYYILTRHHGYKVVGVPAR
jgi:hypothetical protein